MCSLLHVAPHPHPFTSTVRRPTSNQEIQFGLTDGGVLVEGLGRCSARCIEVPFSAFVRAQAYAGEPAAGDGGEPLPKAEGASYFVSFVLALFLAEEHLGRPDSLRRIVPSVTTQLHMSPPWRRLPLTEDLRKNNLINI